MLSILKQLRIKWDKAPPPPYFYNPKVNMVIFALLIMEEAITVTVLVF